MSLRNMILPFSLRVHQLRDDPLGPGHTAARSHDRLLGRPQERPFHGIGAAVRGCAAKPGALAVGVELAGCRSRGLGEAALNTYWRRSTLAGGRPGIPKRLGIRGIRARMGNIQIGDEAIFDHLFPEERVNPGALAKSMCWILNWSPTRVVTTSSPGRMFVT